MEADQMVSVITRFGLILGKTPSYFLMDDLGNKAMDLSPRNISARRPNPPSKLQVVLVA